MAQQSETDFRLKYKVPDIVQQVRKIQTLSLETLQRLYTKYFKEDATGCDNIPVLVRKLQYLLQKKNKKYLGEKMSPKLRETSREVLATPINPIQEETMPKKVKKSKKGTKATKPEVIEEDDEELEDEDLEDEDDDDEDDDSDDDDDDDDEESEDEGDDEDEDEDEDDDEEEGDEPTPKKRTAPIRTGEATVCKLKGKVIKSSFIYELMVKVFQANRKLKATDQEIASAVKKAYPNSTFETYRVEADRKKYNTAKFKGQSEPPENKSVPYTAEGKVLKRVIPEQLRKFVKPGQPVAQTIAENREKGLIPKKLKKLKKK